MSTPRDDDLLIRDLTRAFAAAVDRGVPRQIAALMCADEAESFLDNVNDPDPDDPDEPVEEPTVDVPRIRVFGEVALARFTRPYTAGTLFFRREDGRWTVCADAEDDLSLDQLEDGERPPSPARVRGLRGTPVGDLDVAGLVTLVEQRQGLDILLPRVTARLQREPLPPGDRHPGDLLAATLRVEHEQWAKDPVSLTRMRITIDTVQDMGDLDAHGAPHQEIWDLIARFAATNPNGW
ncbi:contact-dependent growth inhibition system immunity protein [Phytohabitans suffuscus]|uniref:contact-dependent growth inhibition system immunity protein n=1 Tax=Phytohabitans suffuscus TaxID=624315 RepID=UPI0015669498|nr:contact-dependent growth inhibition system immunity protein [Phytohabitans suffuscus]